MRGSDARSGSLFSYVDLEARVPGDHPLRVIRSIADDVLDGLSARFEALYGRIGRPSIPPERLMRALLLQAFYSLRSERQLMERLEFDLLFRWFVGLGVDDRAWDPSTFSKNRDRLMDAEAAAAFLAGVVSHPQVARQMSREHFSVDGTLIDAWASMKSFRPKDGAEDDPGDPPGGGRNADRGWRGAPRSNATHASTTDPDARLYKKASGQASRLCFIGTALMENRSGLVVDGRLTRASGVSEGLAGIDLADQHIRPGGTLAGDKGFDTADFVAELRERRVTPHVAQNHYDTGNARRRSNIDGRTTRHTGYVLSQKARKRIEEIFGWLKTVAGWRKSRFRGLDRTEWGFTLALAAYNLTRMPKLLAQQSTL
ncbi:MAG: IS5 family transposase [Gemmatimonadetes bacterium]|uniref:IS5 family transposase n=1 Tax=Candidatus Kutchimonas denitrificans TaxID=3056748 RepID=A0AAE4Z7Z8_9BACT|nr:IS5 family transposase [Gemmatimonadota bacterium]NIR75353.1 IS5 family transposase [Candidatus Kutchimonas denitrificans]NIT66619.1 IS5 family transposase [Gemmatimonadota bacterium]NIW75072.1 IS5 family transposase [Gemmatimonadota bacterium]NIY35196.1 IS5 family transposase [Gemmatimonadota bacterium]